jgi:hypothetical protein
MVESKENSFLFSLPLDHPHGLLQVSVLGDALSLRISCSWAMHPRSTRVNLIFEIGDESSRLTTDTGRYGIA